MSALRVPTILAITVIVTIIFKELFFPTTFELRREQNDSSSIILFPGDLKPAISDWSVLALLVAILRNLTPDWSICGSRVCPLI